MKVSEFEDKLTLVSDAKLLQMLSAGRRDGPEVAVKMILAEAHRRGIEGLEEEDGRESETLQSSQSIKSVKSVTDESSLGELPLEEADPSTEGVSEDVPAMAPNWLEEEKSGAKVSAAVKVLLYLAALGGLIFGAMKFIHHG